MSLRNIWTIGKRDFKSYFTSPVAYIIIAGFLMIMGWMFFGILNHFTDMGQQQMGMGKGMSIAEGIIRPLYQNMNVIFLFVIPFITMRLFAEEKKLHTLELLMTAPVTLLDIVLGKFFSAFCLIGVMLLATAIYPFLLVVNGNPEWGPILTNYLGIFLIASCYLSLGLLFSATTENQIIATSLTFFSILFMWILPWASAFVGPFWGDVLVYLSLIAHFNNFSQGLLNSTDVIYYLTFTAGGLFLTHRVLDSYRWR